MPQSQRERVCGAGRKGWPKHGVVQNVYDSKQPGEGFVLTMMIAAAAAFGTDDDAAAEAVVDNLRRWAEGDALSRFKGNAAASMYYNLDRTLLPVIVTFSLVRDHPGMAASDRQRIEAWLDELVGRRGPGRERDPDLISSRNNHRYLSDSVTMAWGILRGNDEGFRAGVERYLAALAADAPRWQPAPGDRARLPGARAISGTRSRRWWRSPRWRRRRAMICTASRAGGPVDPSRDRVPARWHRSDRRWCGPMPGRTRTRGFYRNYKVQDLSFMTERGHGRHYMAWTEVYLARFPDSELAQRLARSWPSSARRAAADRRVQRRQHELLLCPARRDDESPSRSRPGRWRRARAVCGQGLAR